MPTSIQKKISRMILQTLRTFKRLLLVLLTLFVLFNLLGFVGVPWLLRYGVEHQVTELLSRPATVGQVRFNPYTLLLQVEKFHLGEPRDAQAFVDFERLTLNASWESLFRLSPVVDEVSLESPQVHVVRIAAQQFNFTDLIEKFSEPSPEPSKGTAEFSVANIRISGGRIDFDDRLLGARHSVEQISLGLPIIANRPAFTEVFVQPLLQASIDGSPFRIEGQTKPFSTTYESEIKLKLDQLELPKYLNYVPTALPVKIPKGALSADLAVVFAQTAKTPLLRITAAVDLTELSIKDKQDQPILDVERIHLADLVAEPLNGTLTLKQLTIDRPIAVVSRDKSGTLNLSKLAAASPKSKAEKQPAGKSDKSVFKFHVDELALNKASLSFTDLSNADPVKLLVTPVNVRIQDISEDFSKPWTIDVIGTLNGKGQFHTSGTVALIPLNANVHVDDEGMDIAPFEPYFGRFLNASLAKAYAKVKGDATVAMVGDDLKISFTGDAALNEFRMLDKATSDLFAGWGGLSFSQIKAAYSDAGTDVQIGRIAFSKFYARIILDKTGKLNLSRIVAQPSAPNASLTRADQVAEVASAPVVMPTPAPQNSASKLKLRFGQIVFDAGQVNFTDNFIKPNYSASLNQIKGKVGAFGTQSTKPATVDVQAKLNASDRVAISGSINPLAKKPSLDLTASAHDVVLTNFTPYSANYTGYPIVAGKLSLDLHYQLDNDQLRANNHIFIDQFTFGDHVDSPNATSLPVRLAVSLLKNARGEIDLNLPVSGSLSDPKFSIGSLIWQVIVNLIEKAITSPFSLLASALPRHSRCWPALSAVPKS